MRRNRTRFYRPMLALLGVMALSTSAHAGSLRARDGKLYEGRVVLESGAWVVRPTTGPAVRIEPRDLREALLVDPDTSPHGLKGNYFSGLGFQTLQATRVDSRINLNLNGVCPVPGVGPENFCVRWTGLIEPRYTEEYTFRSLSDDGFRLLVEGETVIQDWSNGHPATWAQGRIQLVAGRKYKIEAEYFNGSGVAVAQLYWSSASQPEELVPPQALTPAAVTTMDNAIGLRGEYFADTNLKERRLSRIDPTIDFGWGEGTPDPDVPVNGFSVRWTGKIIPRNFEMYTFTLAVDHGVRLWVNGKLIIDQWQDLAPREVSGELPLAAGQAYDIKLEYFKTGGQGSVEMYWSSGHQAKEVVPTRSLVPSDDPAPRPAATTSPAMPQNWSEPEPSTGVVLRDGSMLAGIIEGIDDQHVTLRPRAPLPLPGEILHAPPKPLVVPRGQVAVVLYAPPTSEQLARLVAGKPGALIESGDYIDGDIRAIAPDHADIDSVLFGPTSLDHSQLVGVALCEVNRAGTCEIRTEDGSRLVLKSLDRIKVEQGRLVIDHPILGRVSLAQGELYEVTAAP